MLFTSTAYAMGAGGQAGGDAPSPLVSFAPLLLMFVVFYFLLIRPQQKRAKEHRQMLASLRRGDVIITVGGLHGTILEADDDTLVVDLGETKVTVSRSYVAALAKKAPGKRNDEQEKSK